MDLAYLGGSLAGVALLVALNAVLFGTKMPRLTAARSEAYLAQISPAFRVRNIALAEDGTAALVENGVDSTLHLIVARGDDLVMRKLTPALVSGVARDGPMLALRLADFTLPRATLRLGDAALWERKLAEAVR